MEIEPNEDMMQGIRRDAAKLKQIKEQNQFKFFIQKSVKDLYKDFMENDKEKTRELDYTSFEKALKEKVGFPIYLKDQKELFTSIFNEFDNKKNGKINYQQFLENIKTFHYIGDTDLNMDLGQWTQLQNIGISSRFYLNFYRARTLI